MGLLTKGAGKFSVSVKQIDHGYRKIQAEFKKLAGDKLYVKAGVLGDGGKHQDDGTLTNAQLAILLNYGTSNMRARPHIGPSFELHRQEYLRLLTALVQGKAYRGDFDYARVLAIVGTKMASDMKRYVTAGPEVPPPNAPSTLLRKQSKNAARSKGKAQGDPRTLIDTGRYVSSFTYEVVEREVVKQKGFTPGHQGDLK